MASIKQNPAPIPITLPDMRNLGVQLRVLVIANAMAMVAAMLANPTLAQAWDDMLQISAALQPVLLASMLVFFIAHRWLARMSYGLGVTTVFVLVLALTTAMHLASNALFGQDASPPLLRQWIFSAIVTGVLLLYFNLRDRALSPALTEARLQALQARIRPHFLFNTINTVLSLIRRDPQRAETALEDLADLFRTLMADNRNLVTLDSEVRLCRQYLALEQLRLGDRLQVQWHSDNMPADALIPPLLLQPLLENAVYHGVEPADTGGDIVINIYRRHQQLHILLSNPYSPGGARHGGNRMALANIRERLALHFDAEAKLDIQLTESKYQIHIVIPYRTEP